MTLPKGYKPIGKRIMSWKERLKTIGLTAAVGSIFAVGTLLGLLLDS
ncbi:MAG TPA: hypothetical protein VIA09_01905 [Nitrososphaeraceae archaeon]